jgi:hypothetical protein
MIALELNSRIDQWTHILTGRSSSPPLRWLYPGDRRRITAYGILDWYEAGASNKAISDLPLSYQKNWIDTGIVAYLGGKLAELTLTGFKAQLADDDKGSQALAAWVEESELDLQLGEIERLTSIYGDGVARVAWDDARGIPVVQARHPGMYYANNAEKTSVVLVAHNAYDQQYLDVEWYYLDGARVFMVQQQIKVSDLTGLGNEKPLVERLTAAPVELACTALPIIHVPNRSGADDRWGESDFSRVLALIDCWHKSACTDARIISERMAAPTRFVTSQTNPQTRVAADGTRRTQFEYEPGVMYWLGETGSVTQLDNDKALDLVIKYDGVTWDKILKFIGLTRAGIGETGETGGLREFQVKLMYGPTEQTILRRRRARLPRWRNALRTSRELWQGMDAGGYKKRFGDKRLEDAQLSCGPLMPEDVESHMTMLATGRAQGGLPRKYYVAEIMKALNVAGNVEEAMKLLEDEDRSMPGISPLA